MIRLVQLRQRTRNERGAIAIMVAILATGLFSAAAMTVDLGNAWARKREVQKQVDVGALSVGWMLPMTTINKTSIAQKVADYFNDLANDVPGQADTVTAAQLLNGATGDGEVSFQNDDWTSCTDNCPQMQVIAPTAVVNFGLASVIGFKSGKVQRQATVRITSELPPKEKTLPFWLPTGCGFGPTEADTTQGNGNQVTTPTATPTPTATATATPTDQPYSPSPVGTHVLSGAAVTSVGYLGVTTVSGFSVSGVGNQFKKVTLRAYPPTGTAFVDFAAQTTGDGAVPSFSISHEVSDTVGDWRIYALADKNSSMEYSSNYLILRVNPPQVTPSPTPTPTATPTDAGVVVGCVGQDRGNFGQLDSPRLEGGTKQARLAKNIALGIDHTLVPYVFPTGVAERKDCGAPDGSLLPGAHLDDTSLDGNNCITGDTGNDGPKIMDGLVQGISGVGNGRLDVANGATTCAGRTNVTLAGKLINNDVLSCFLKNGATLSSITQASGVTTSMLDQSIVKSPRFVWLPVVYATDRAQKNFQPIRYFVPGFITDETQSTAATASNGLEIDGNSVSTLHIFTFNRDALAPIEGSETVDYQADSGGAIVRLVG